MLNIERPAPFVLISSNHGTMIINRNDYHTDEQGLGLGVGYQLMTKSCFDPQEVNLALALLRTRQRNFGAGVVAIDCGANVGVHTIEWGRLMHKWGRVISFEAQEKIFYAMAGNVAINNCLNVTARWAAVGAECGTLQIPEPDYLVPSSFGSFELKKRAGTEFIGQQIDYEGGTMKTVDVVSIDSLGLDRLDFIKIDVEGMEVEVLQGARNAIAKFRPQMMIEVLKSDADEIRRIVEDAGYHVFPLGLNLLAVHEDDPVRHKISLDKGVFTLGA